MPTPTEVRAVFNEVYNGQPNFMTPTILRYGNIGNLGYEISKGRGIYDETIFGFTVIELDTKKRRLDLCECFHSMSEVNAAIKNLN